MPDPPVVPPAPTIICSGATRQRDPAKFSGAEDQDVEDWLSAYERVSMYNRWDDVMKFNNVGFYLTLLAETWFNNNVAGIDTWSEFKTRFLRAFGRPAVRKLLAEQSLRTRAQKTGETFTSYIEDVLDLCRRVDPSMAEADKIKHVMKGIDNDAFQMLLARDPRSIADVVNLCQSFDELRRQRSLTRRPSAPDDILASLIGDPESPSLLSRIKELVREEVARQLSLLPCVAETPSPVVPTLRRVIQEQVAEALPRTAVVDPHHMTALTAPMTYAETAARSPPAPIMTCADTMGVPPRQAAPSYQRPVPPMTPFPPVRPPAQFNNGWRTWDNRPICFLCRYAGHVAKYCRRIPPATAVLRPPTYGLSNRPPVPHDVSDGYHISPSPADHRASGNRRSSSPRRRSISPMRRRQPASEEEN